MSVIFFLWLLLTHYDFLAHWAFEGSCKRWSTFYFCHAGLFVIPRVFSGCRRSRLEVKEERLPTVEQRVSLWLCLHTPTQAPVSQNLQQQHQRLKKKKEKKSYAMLKREKEMLLPAWDGERKVLMAAGSEIRVSKAWAGGKGSRKEERKTTQRWKKNNKKKEAAAAAS